MGGGGTYSLMDLPVSAISLSVNRGDIFHSDFKGIDHGKFFVVMGVSKDHVCGFFFVNSNINKYIFSKPEFLALQYLLRHSEYPFLRYDSFVCASNVMRISLNKLSEDISNNKTKIIGSLKPEHIDDILDMVVKSEVINEKDKKLFFYSE